MPLQTLALLEEEDDINQITDYFSYEHFYVIYCKFWELDTDHDLYINQKDLSRYNDQGKLGCRAGAHVPTLEDEEGGHRKLNFLN